jgi:hypothetical protein
MDESFQLHARRTMARTIPARLDFDMLTAALAAQARTSAAARAQAKSAPPPPEPIDDILLAESEWQDAVAAQRGCFNRAEVRRRRNAP